MSPDDRLSTAIFAKTPLPISPTDVAQFVRLDQCRRFLRLRLHERVAGNSFLRDFDVAPQEIPPLLTRAGAEFEAQVTEEVRARYRVRDFAAEAPPPGERSPNNHQVIDIARSLPPGETIVLLQPRLQAEIAGWLITGDIDLLRLERDADGNLHPLIADMKSSTTAKVEHRLQVAFYHELLTRIFDEENLSHAPIEMAILYRGESAAIAAVQGDPLLGAGERPADIANQIADAERLFGTSGALLERVPDPDAYLGAIRDLVTGDRAVARRVTVTPFADLPFHLTYKCDGCLYNEFCMKWCAQRDDLSLIPHLTDTEKTALRQAGVRTTRDLATLKEPAPGARDETELAPAPGREELVARLATTWPVGPRLDELIYRARRYRKFKGDPFDPPADIPSKGYGSLPYCDANHNPNLVRVYLDAQHDYLANRVYLLGALVVAAEGGEIVSHRRRAIVRLCDGPPNDEREEALFVDWVEATIRAIVELAAPDELGEPNAPVHLIFYNRFDQRCLLEGLGRHAETVFGATPLYDFVTQIAAFDSPVLTFLTDEIRDLKNFPMVCQSLQSVATFLKFDWSHFREIFRERFFDYAGRFPDGAIPNGDQTPWYTRRARFSSQIPLEYAYAAWNELEAPPSEGKDPFAPYRHVTPDHLIALQTRRLEAMEHIASRFRGNQQTQKTSFHLPDLASFLDRKPTLADALDEFVTIERHADLAQWKAARHPEPERRVLSGDTLIGRYEEADQSPETRVRLAQYERRRQCEEEMRAAYRAQNPDASRVQLTREQRQATNRSLEGITIRLRLDDTDLECDLNEALLLTTLRDGDPVVIMPRWTVDERLPPEEQRPFAPTPKQLLYGMRARLVGFEQKLGPDGRVEAAWAVLALQDGPRRSLGSGYVFRGVARPLIPGERYTIDPDPNSFYDYWCKKITEGLKEGGENTLFHRLDKPGEARASWPEAAKEGQARFLAALDALHEAGALHGWEPSKREYIAGHGSTPTLLVQGPPGTGKSYTTAFALFARMQGAMAAGLPFRVIVSCKTHSATDVLVRNIVDAQEKLRLLYSRHREHVRGLLDERLFDVPIYRYRPKGDPPHGAVPLHAKAQSPEKTVAADRFTQQPWAILGATPGGIYGLIKERWSNGLFGHFFADCLVLDEASQMNLPEAIMAALPLKPEGQLIVVGDHRQMPPIVQHDWLAEPRRTFKTFRSYESLFLTLRDQTPPPPMIKFERSFRLHADVAEFLRQEIYRLDGIPYHSLRTDVLPRVKCDDPFVAAVLEPDHPLVVIVHDEEGSQVRNLFERDLLAPVLDALSDAALYDQESHNEGYGVVVPHRAQRATLKEFVDRISALQTRPVPPPTVDTVERFQGDERTVILVSATESDPEYLLVSSEFLLDPRRLTVALSRAKRKLILVAARSVFEIFSADEETFANAQLWKNLLRRTCTTLLWEGKRCGHHVQVWGNSREQREGLGVRDQALGARS